MTVAYAPQFGYFVTEVGVTPISASVMDYCSGLIELRHQYREFSTGMVGVYYSYDTPFLSSVVVLRDAWSVTADVLEARTVGRLTSHIWLPTIDVAKADPAFNAIFASYLKGGGNVEKCAMQDRLIELGADTDLRECISWVQLSALCLRGGYYQKVGGLREVHLDSLKIINSQTIHTSVT